MPAVAHVSLAGCRGLSLPGLRTFASEARCLRHLTLTAVPPSLLAAPGPHPAAVAAVPSTSVPVGKGPESLGATSNTGNNGGVLNSPDKACAASSPLQAGDTSAAPQIAVAGDPQAAGNGWSLAGCTPAASPPLRHHAPGALQPGTAALVAQHQDQLAAALAAAPQLRSARCCEALQPDAPGKGGELVQSSAAFRLLLVWNTMQTRYIYEIVQLNELWNHHWSPHILC